jgi:ribonuclease HII
MKKEQRKVIAGLDEVGMGALAGSIVIAVAVFDDDEVPEELEQICDSKKASKTKRARLAPVVARKALFFGIGWATAEEIDRYGKGVCWERAALMALEGAPELDELLVDGIVPVDGYRGKQTTVIKGDQKHWQISSASFLAKVFRDREMAELDLEGYAGMYDWGSNSGYGTKAHFAMIDFKGISPHHRKTFLRKHFAMTAGH